MHKRIFACVLSAAILLTLGACSNQNAGSSAGGAAVTMSSIPDQPAVRGDSSSAQDTAAASEQTPAQNSTPDPGADTTAAQSSDMPTFYAEGKAKADEGKMEVTVFLEHNPGFQLVTVRMYYDEALTPVDSDGRCTYEDGTIVSGGMSTCPYNAAEHLIGYVAVCQTPAKADGDLFTVALALPDGAKAGDSYDFSFEIVDFNNGTEDVPATARTSTVTVE